MVDGDRELGRHAVHLMMARDHDVKVAAGVEPVHGIVEAARNEAGLATLLDVAEASGRADRKKGSVGGELADLAAHSLDCCPNYCQEREVGVEGLAEDSVNVRPILEDRQGHQAAGKSVDGHPVVPVLLGLGDQ